MTVMSYKSESEILSMQNAKYRDKYQIVAGLTECNYYAYSFGQVQYYFCVCCKAQLSQKFVRIVCAVRR